MLMIWIILGVTLVGFYFLFKDTLNRVQYIQAVRLYWITRDDGIVGSPVLSKAFMIQTAQPWWNGKGVRLRAGKYTFQIGVLTHRGESLLDQLGGRDLDDDARRIRDWGNGEAKSRTTD